MPSESNVLIGAGIGFVLLAMAFNAAIHKIEEGCPNEHTFATLFWY